MTVSKSRSARRALRSIAVITFEMVMRTVFALPRYRTCCFVKKIVLRVCGANVGRRVTIYPDVWIAPGRNLSIGDDVDLALGVILSTSGGVFIGDRALIGYRTQVLSTNHVIPFGKERIHGSGHTRRSITIGADTWIGANCIILAGVSIGEGAVVGAGSVVTKDVAPFTIVAGNPAQVIKNREMTLE